MPIKVLLCLLLAGAIAGSVLSSPILQESFSLPGLRTGRLRRFDIDGSEVERILQLAEDNNLDVWQVARSHVDIYSPPAALELPHSLRDIPHTETNISVPAPRSTLLDEPDWSLGSLQNSTFHSEYHPLYEIDAFVNELVASYPDLIRVVNLGHSGEGREMLGLRISSGGTKFTGGWRGEGKKKRKWDENAKPGFVISGAQHAREWVATASSLYLAHALVSNASEPHSLASLLNDFDFHIIPTPNPDGYTYTWESDRFWYKNRQTMGPVTKCVGLDMNRNWGYKWKPTPVGMVAESTEPREPTDPCSHWYPGHRPFEAPEVNNIANYITTLPNLVGFVDLRSYGQMLSSPYSFSCKRLPKDAEDQIEAGLGAVQALKMVHGTSFQVGSLCSMLYRAPGNIVDWMYARAGIKYSYAVHLRDTGTYGFSLPPQWIRPVGEETGGMIAYIARFVAKQLKNKK